MLNNVQPVLHHPQNYHPLKHYFSLVLYNFILTVGNAKAASHQIRGSLFLKWLIENHRGLDFRLIGLDLFYFLDIYKFGCHLNAFQYFFHVTIFTHDLKEYSPSQQGYYPRLKNTRPHIQYPCHKLVQKMVAQIIYRYSFQVAKGDNPTNFTLWPPKKRKTMGISFSVKLRKKLQTGGEIIKVSKPQNLKTNH